MNNVKRAIRLLLSLQLLATISIADPYVYYFTSRRLIAYTRPDDPNPDQYKLSFQLQREDPLNNEGVLFYSKAKTGEVTLIEVANGFLYQRCQYGPNDADASGFKLWEKDVFNVTISVDESGRNFSINKVSSYSTSTSSKYVPLGDTVYIGGYPTGASISSVESVNPFRGCITDFTVNGVNVFKKARDGDLGPISQPTSCPVPTSYIYLSGEDSYLIIAAEDTTSKKLEDLSLELRTYDFNATLIHIETDDGNLTISYTQTSISVVLSNGTQYDLSLADSLGNGDYYTMGVDKLANAIVFSITKKDRSFGNSLSVKFDTDSLINKFYIGGFPGDLGLQSCVRELFINNNRFEVRNLQADNLKNVVLGECVLINKCDKTCSHGGKCIRGIMGVTCDCTDTGYGGPSCHTPLHPRTCEDVTFPQNTNEVDSTIDIDGAGPLPGAQVKCVKDPANGEVKTVIQTTDNKPDSQIRIDGFQAPGSYKKSVTYKTGIEPAMAIIDRAQTCQQYVSYTCQNSRLMVKPADSEVPFSWWVGRDNKKHYYWGSAAPDSYQCSCATTQTGCEGGLGCNCDAGLSTEAKDDGYLTNKTHLPITEVRFGDTGDQSDGKFAVYQINSVECTGDYFRENPVTLQSLESVIKVSTDSYHIPMDVSFQFKTTIPKSQLFYIPMNEWSFLSILMGGPHSIQVTVGSQFVTFEHEQTVTPQLNDDNWHSIYFELTKTRALLRVDSVDFAIWEPETPVWYDVFIGRKAIFGGNPMGTFGYTGCVRDFSFQGESFDLVKLVNEDGDINTVAGCSGKCSNNSMCRNGGSCTEYYATYMCDCSTTAFSGCYCGQAVGVTFPSGSWMKFMTQARFGATHRLSSIELYFRTSQVAGVLAHVQGTGQRELLTIQLNAAGFVVVTFADGNSAQKTITSSKTLADDNSHRLSIRVTKSGDNSQNSYEVQFDEETQTATAAVYSNVPAEFFLASANSAQSQTGFNGCIYGVLYNGVPLLKEAKQEPKPAYISFSDSVAVTSSCGGSQQEVTRTDSAVSQSDHKRPVYLTSFGRSSMDSWSYQTPDMVVDQTTSLVCKTETDEPTRYSITQNGGELTCPHLKVNNIIVLPPDDRVTGQYQCKASNAWTTAVSRYQTVVIANTPSVANVVQEDATLVHLEYGRLSCNIRTNSVPEAETRWEGVNLTDPRFYQSVDGDLHFVYVTLADARSYSCYKFNRLLNTEVLVKQITVQLRVPAGSEPRPTPPVKLVYSTPSPVIADPGSYVVLECLADGPDPLPEITWAKGENTPSLPVKSRQLKLSAVGEQFKGDYFCKTGNTTLTKFELDYSMKPRWQKRPMRTVVYINDDAILYCKTHPLPNTTSDTRQWFINGEPLQVSDRYSLNEDGDTLTIVDALKTTDILVFQCNVSNEYGYAFGEGSLHVVSPTIVTEKPKPQVTISEKRNFGWLNVKCDTDVDTNVTFTWYRGDTKIQNSAVYSVFRGSGTSSLQIRLNDKQWDSSLKKYAGIYRCVIYDGVKHHTVSTNVKLEFPEDPNPGDKGKTDTNSAIKGSSLSSAWISFFLALSIFVRIQL